MKRRSRERPIPKIFLYAVLVLIAYGAVSNYLVFSTQNMRLLGILNVANIAITVLWFFTNIILFIFFHMKRYESEAKIFTCYYVLINGFNILNLFIDMISDWKILFAISVITKVIELIACIRLLQKRSTYS